MKLVSSTLAILSLIAFGACKQRVQQSNSGIQSVAGASDQAAVMKIWDGCYKRVNNDGSAIENGQAFCLKVTGNKITLDNGMGLDPYTFALGEADVEEESLLSWVKQSPSVAAILAREGVAKIRGKTFSALTNDGKSLTLRKDVYHMSLKGSWDLYLSTSWTHNLVSGDTRKSDRITQIYHERQFFPSGRTGNEDFTNEFVRQ